jgi:NCS1 family nucleobase:cation symporter-1
MSFFIPGLTGMIGFWATLSLNIPDFSRYAVSQRAQVVGQALGLPLAMAFYSFIGVAVTSATAVIFGRTIWDPLEVLVQFRNPAVLIVAMVALCIATLATNIAANVVSPANDFAHLAPSRISFRIGGLITGVIGILMMPWKLVADPSGYIFTWLVGYSALLGPIGGIMIADYFVLRRMRLDVRGLYDPNGPYRFSGGWGIPAIAAFLAGALPNLPGFLAQVGWIDAARVPTVLLEIYGFAWFAGFAIAFVAYLLFRKLAPTS